MNGINTNPMMMCVYCAALPGARHTEECPRFAPVQGAASATDRATDEREALADLRKAVLDGVSDEWLLGFIRQQPLAASSASASGAKFGQGGATPDNSGPINHAEAYELACAKRDKSNLARCYIDLRAALAERAQAARHPEITPMFLLNVALCIEGIVVVSPAKRKEIVDKLQRVADELRATPAPVAAQPSGAVADAWGVMEGGKLIYTSTSKGLVESWLPYGSGRTLVSLAIATPTPEQEAAPLDLRKAAQSVVASFNDPHVSLASVQRQVNMLADALAAPVAQEAEQPQGDVMRPFGAPAGQQGAGVPMLASEVIGKILLESNGHECRNEAEFPYDFARRIEAEVARRFRAQGGITSAKDGESVNLGAANTNKGGDRA